MLYIKNGVLKDSKTRLDTEDGRSIFNPSPEDWISEGWEEYNPAYATTYEVAYHYEKSLAELKDDAKQDAEDFFNTMLDNLDPIEERMRKRQIAEDLAEAGYIDAALLDDSEELININSYIQYLKYLNVYEYDCRQILKNHKAYIDECSTSSELERYDYTRDYPKRKNLREF